MKAIKLSQLVAVFSVMTGLSVLASVAPNVFYLVNLIPFGDKLGHFILYGICGMAVVRFTRSYGYRWVVFGLCMTSIYVIGDELLQHSLENRTFSVGDLLASLCGVLSAWILVKKPDLVQRQ